MQLLKPFGGVFCSDGVVLCARVCWDLFLSAAIVY